MGSKPSFALGLCLFLFHCINEKRNLWCYGLLYLWTTSPCIMFWGKESWKNHHNFHLSKLRLVYCLELDCFFCLFVFCFVNFLSKDHRRQALGKTALETSWGHHSTQSCFVFFFLIQAFFSLILIHMGALFVILSYKYKLFQNKDTYYMWLTNKWITLTPIGRSFGVNKHRGLAS